MSNDSSATTMPSLSELQQDITALFPDAQLVIFNLVNLLNNESKKEPIPLLSQLQQDIAALSPDAQLVIFNLVNLLKNESKKESIQQLEQRQTGNTYQQFVESGLIGCIAIEEDLSRTYKEVLAEGWGKKYDHR